MHCLRASLNTSQVAIVVMVLFSCVNADMNQQSLNIITVATVGSQMVTATGFWLRSFA